MTFRHYIVAGFILLFAQGAVGQITSDGRVKAEPHIIQSLIEQYEAECYADSTQENVHDDGTVGRYLHPTGATPCWIETDNSPLTYWGKPIVTCRRPDHWKKYWKHREPTYQGFKEFIKRRMK